MTFVMVNVIWRFKKKTHKVHMNVGQHKDFKNMFIGPNFFEKQKISISKIRLKIKSNFGLSKIHNYHLVKVFKNNNSNLILLIHSSSHI
jgi:hypothetical protein